MKNKIDVCKENEKLQQWLTVHNQHVTLPSELLYLISKLDKAISDSNWDIGSKLNN